jgi:membrane-associated phospholipid phosphatase
MRAAIVRPRHEAIRASAALWGLLLVAHGPGPAWGEPAPLPSPPASPGPERRPLLTRADLRFAAASVLLVAAATRLDRWAEDEAPEENGPAARRLAFDAEHAGNPLYVGSALLLTSAAGRLLGRPALTGAATRIGAGVLGAGIAAGGIKLAVGRPRPYQSPGDADDLRPFSGRTSFPSGHATVAFALASGIDRETTARWVPWVVYPAAAGVGWSRVRDGKHWASDVAAGALLGTWTARKVINWIHRREGKAR